MEETSKASKDQTVEKPQASKKPHKSQWYPIYGIFKVVVDGMKNKPTIAETNFLFGVIWHAICTNIVLFSILFLV